MNDADRVCDEECLFSRYVALTYIRHSRRRTADRVYWTEFYKQEN